MTERAPRIVIRPEEVANPPRSLSTPVLLHQETPLAPSLPVWLQMLLISVVPVLNTWWWWRLPVTDVTQRRLARAVSLVLGTLSLALLAGAVIWLWPRNWMEQIVARSERSVVQIQQGQTLGTGVVIASKGNQHLILTNKHVVGHEGPVMVAARMTQAVPAEVAGFPRRDDVDLALVVVMADGLRPLGPLAPFESLRVGQPVVAIGHPEGLAYTVTDGIISAKRAGMLLQTSAPINPGNSGGPLISKRGEIVGINTWKVDRSLSEGLGFAIRADWVLERDEWTYRQDIGDLLDRIPQ